ncbi:hypothetical protein IGS68_08725 [Skermanella sp. TT6]|uniref:Restriction endonuclease n=1 Tax=Skermanella cutis TaxID=2775420 RepID=A0ABX7BA79_9PROT|nr:hypothetical protein [Skermanella sp. TT6]QQP91271.1 hypothetical protein IGS68_08725 [Skermanella sp. TT6]
MTMISIANPLWRPSEAIVQRLNLAVLQEIGTGKSNEFGRNERHHISRTLAMDATMAMLAPAAKIMPVVDADEIRRNMPGYDILVGDRLRVQVKGGTYVDSIGWAHTANRPEAADLNFDIEIAVDIGAILDPRPLGRRRDGREDIPMRRYVDFYIIPGDVIRAQVAKGIHVNGRGVHLYLYKRRIRPGTKEHDCQWFGMAEWRNRFDVVENALKALST